MAASGSRPRYSVTQKLEILQYARTHSVKATCDRFNVARSSIYVWSSTEAALIQSAQQQHIQGRERIAMATSSSSEEETPATRPSIAAHSQGEARHSVNSVGDTRVPSRTAITPALRAHEHDTHIAETQQTHAHQPFGDNTPRPPTDNEDAMADFAIVGYQGAVGGFAQLAANRTLSGLLARRALHFPAFETTGYRQASYVLDALQKNEIDLAFVATDVLLSNTHHATLDRMVASRLRMIGEVISQDEIVVCALPGTELCDVDCVISDWPTLQRCEEYILHLELQYDKRIYRQVTWDSATGCRVIQEERAEKTLALCSTAAATSHRLVVLQSGVTRAPSTTRYTILGHHGTDSLAFDGIRQEQVPSTSKRHCTLLVKGTERAILDVISAFAYRGLEIVSFHMRGGCDGQNMRSYVISYRASTNPLIESGLQQHLAVAAERVVVLGNYETVLL